VREIQNDSGGEDEVREAPDETGFWLLVTCFVTLRSNADRTMMMWRIGGFLWSWWWCYGNKTF